MVMSALLVGVVLMTVYDRQVSARVEDEASSLISGLSRAAFQSFSTGAMSFIELPRSVGGSGYVIEVVDNRCIVLRITDGPLRERKFVSAFTFPLVPQSRTFYPGQSVFFLRTGDTLTVNQSRIERSDNLLRPQVYESPPNFYWFAKNNPVEASGVLAVFFGSGADIAGYGWINGNILVVETSENWFFRVDFENEPCKKEGWNIVSIESVSRIEEVTAARITDTCPSVREAAELGWLVPPEQAFASLRSRTWMDSDGLVRVPPEVSIVMACVSSGFGKYPAWQISFENRVVLFRAVLWWYEDNDPGFLFQSLPGMYPVE